jgi:uncharacterized damage-inducible protein DinB
MPLAPEFAALLDRDLRRAAQQLAAFPAEEQLWLTVPGVANSAGNLALHLEGNLREYIGRQLGGIAYTRQRPAEFATKGIGRDELIARLEAVRASIVPVVAVLDEARLDAVFPENVLGQPLSARQFLLHLLGHFNYHLGQIDLLRRALTGNGAIPMAGLQP